MPSLNFPTSPRPPEATAGKPRGYSKAVFLALMILPLAGCLATASDHPQPGVPSQPPVESRPADTIQDIPTAEQRWKARAAASYRFQASQLCYCLPEARAPRIIEVVDGAISKVRMADTGQPDPSPPDMLLKTISEWFDYLQEKSRIETATVTGTFMADTGFPRRISVDLHPRMADDEFSVEFSGYLPAEPAGEN
ncbi:MAG: DUF6174 domain-containing protein [Ketobacteraceae bacterium]|nr:DUF6174 domain-containing protein [Ketobacteraceae bacterium]